MWNPEPPHTPSPPETELVERLTMRAANDGEALISAVRTAFCLVVLGRFVTLDDAFQMDRQKVAIEIVLLVLASMASAFAFLKARQGHFRTWLEMSLSRLTW